MTTKRELEKLARMDREASDDWTGIYDAFDGVSTLKTGRITLTSDATDARDDVFMACAARNALPSLLAEVRELRAKLARVKPLASALPTEYIEGEWRTPTADGAEPAAVITCAAEPSPETGHVGWCWWALGKMGDAPSYEAAKAAAEAVIAGHL